jgi:hypothetical protein
VRLLRRTRGGVRRRNLLLAALQLLSELLGRGVVHLLLRVRLVDLLLDADAVLAINVQRFTIPFLQWSIDNGLYLHFDSPHLPASDAFRWALVDVINVTNVKHL